MYCILNFKFSFVLEKCSTVNGTKRGARLIDTRRLLEGGVYFLSKVTHSNHYRNKLTALLNSNSFELEQDTISKPLIQRGR